MKFVIRRVEPEGHVRFICPYCGSTVVIVKETETVDLPDICSHCGRDVYFMGNDFEEDSDE